MWSCENLRLAPVSAAIGVFLSPRLLRAQRLVLHSSILETCYRESLRNDGLAFRAGRKTLHKGAGETHPLSEFLAGIWLWLLSRRRGEHEH